MTARSTGPVLVVTEAEDITADMVIAALDRRGVPVVRFDLADIGDALAVSARFGAHAVAGSDPDVGASARTQPGVVPAAPRGQVRTPSRTAELSQLRSVYWRRPRWPTFDHLDEPDARFATAQVRHGLGGVLYALAGCPFVNHPLRTLEAEHKPLQLAVAQHLGLTVPPTLVSNDVAQAREFVASHGDVVYKALRWTPYRRGDVGMTTWTEPVSVEELDATVAVTPHLFQSRVPKVADVRVVVVGTRVFAVRIDSGLLDWRTDYSALSYVVVDLPDGLERSLHACLRRFGLASGSFDLAIDRDGEYHWLELNPNGQWGWLEGETGLDLSGAFADLLAREGS